MTTPQQPMPSLPFQKDNGRWTFYAYPNGAQEEAGEYLDEDAAKQAAMMVWRIWEANGFTYGPIGVIN
jgi:hypothetical protein